MKNCRLALSLIVRDEERFLPGCLESVRDLVDEIIIGDTGSTDQTVSIARDLGAEVFSQPWTNDFSLARNAVLDRVRADWILHLDADERWAGPSRTELEPMLSATTAEAFFIKVRNLHPEGDPVHYLDSPQVRLFRNRTNYRYRNSIHEQISASITENGGHILDTNWLIRHEGYLTQPERKAERNLELLQKALIANPEDVYLRLKLGETYKALGRIDQAIDILAALERTTGSILPEEIKGTLYLRLAQLYLSRDDFENSNICCREGLRLQPDNLVLHYVYSVCSLYLNQTEAALNSLQKILSESEAGFLDLELIRRLYNLVSRPQNPE